MSIQLAIVIPTYRGRFISQTLDALVAQTSHAFNLYIGDDNSPDDIGGIVKPYEVKLNIKYKKFNENLGQKSLTSHWERCIEMAGSEKWVWLLPDDDVPTPECVEVFLSSIQGNSSLKHVYRFQTLHINEQGDLSYTPNLCPREESNVDFILRKMRYERNSSVAEYIFDKAEYYRVGKFADIPMGWCSDDWMWIKLSQQYDIETLPGGIVQLRQSSVNISSNNVKHYSIKLEAKYTFLKLMFSDPSFIGKVKENYTMDEFRNQVIVHLFNEYRGYQKRFLNTSLLLYAKRNNVLFGGGILKNIYRLLRFQIKNKC